MDNGKRVLRLKCGVQNYAWGRRGEQSAVGRLYALQSKEAIEPDKPYAELWMGTHESGPSFIVMDSHIDGGSAANGAVNGVQDDIAETSREDKGCNCDDEACSKSLMLLKDWLSRNPSAMGDKVLQRWGADLPFLFKVNNFCTCAYVSAHFVSNLCWSDCVKLKLAYRFCQLGRLCRFKHIRTNALRSTCIN